MRKDILALAIVKKGGGGGQLDDGLYNVENGNAENLKTKVCASDSSGEMIAQGRYADDDPGAETGSILYYKDGANMNNIYLEGIIGNEAHYVWGNKTIGLVYDSLTTGAWYEAEFVTGGNNKHILKPISKPSGTINIDSNGTYDVTGYASAVVTGILSGRGEVQIANSYEHIQPKNASVDVYVLGASLGAYNRITSDSPLRGFYDPENLPCRDCRMGLFIGSEHLAYNKPFNYITIYYTGSLTLCHIDCHESNDSSDWEITYRRFFKHPENNQLYFLTAYVSTIHGTSIDLRTPSSERYTEAYIDISNAVEGITESDIKSFVEDAYSFNGDEQFYAMTVDGKEILRDTSGYDKFVVLDLASANIYVNGLPSGSGSGSGGGSGGGSGSGY